MVSYIMFCVLAGVAAGLIMKQMPEEWRRDFEWEERLPEGQGTLEQGRRRVSECKPASDWREHRLISKDLAEVVWKYRFMLPSLSLALGLGWFCWTICPELIEGNIVGVGDSVLKLWRAGNQVVSAGHLNDKCRWLADLLGSGILQLMCAEILNFTILTLLIVICVCDMQRLVIPDQITTALGFAAALTLLAETVIMEIFAFGIGNFPGEPVSRVFRMEGWLELVEDRVLGFLLGFGVYFLLALVSGLASGCEAVGGGDIKLIGMMGLLTGVKGVIVVMAVAALVTPVIILFIFALKFVGKGMWRLHNLVAEGGKGKAGGIFRDFGGLYPPVSQRRGGNSMAVPCSPPLTLGLLFALVSA